VIGSGLSPAIVDRYLDRIGVARPARPTPEALFELQRAHLRAIPFENASILRGEPIPLDLPALVSKVLDRGRGGFCYELNGLFAALLEALGYTVLRRSARVFAGDSGIGPPFDHLCLDVPLHGERYLADVGFGYSFLEPLRFVDGAEQDDPTAPFRLIERPDLDGAVDVEQRHADGTWRGQYRIEPGVFELADFEPMCEFQRTSPEASFIHGWILSRATKDGFVSIHYRKFMVSHGRSVDTRIVDDDAELAELVARWFDV